MELIFPVLIISALFSPTELQTLQAGEGGYPGDDREAPQEHAARADDR